MLYRQVATKMGANGIVTIIGNSDSGAARSLFLLHALPARSHF